MSLVASIITVYCALFYLSDIPIIYDSTDPTVRSADNGCIIISLTHLVRLDNDTKLFFFVMIVLANVLFFQFWAYKMYLEAKSMIILKMKFIYLYLCLCGNSKKYEVIKKKTLAEEENEILREEFMNCNSFLLIFSSK